MTIENQVPEVFSFNTATEVTAGLKKPEYKPNILPLVPEDYPTLKEVMPEFDFSNPPMNPNELASALVDTCKHYRGYGLSANQCGLKYRVFVMGAEDEYVAFFNPKLIESEGEAHMIEGCLSFPMLGLRITRPKEIVVEYQDFTGVLRQQRLAGISARCFLHELDHLNGIVYTERTKPLALKSGLEKRNKTIKKMGKYHAFMKAQELINEQKSRKNG
jgi:peptide deformylase